MSLALVMWSVYGVLVAITVLLYIYRGRLQRDEEDQIFLDDSFEHERAEQQAIVARVNKIEPSLRVMKWLVGIATVLVIVYYLWDIVTQFKYTAIFGYFSAGRRKMRKHPRVSVLSCLTGIDCASPCSIGT